MRAGTSPGRRPRPRSSRASGSSTRSAPSGAARADPRARGLRAASSSEPERARRGIVGGPSMRRSQRNQPSARWQDPEDDAHRGRDAARTREGTSACGRRRPSGVGPRAWSRGRSRAPDLVVVTEVALAEGVSVALVEQPYRVAGRRAPAPAHHLDASWTTVVDRLRADELSGLRLVVGGRSLGARVACRTARLRPARSASSASPSLSCRPVARRPSRAGSPSSTRSPSRRSSSKARGIASGYRRRRPTARSSRCPAITACERTRKRSPLRCATGSPLVL